MAKYKFLNNIKTGVVERIEITGDELKELEARETAWDSKANKLKEIKVNRLQCLQETDWYSNYSRDAVLFCNRDMLMMARVFKHVVQVASTKCVL